MKFLSCAKLISFTLAAIAGTVTALADENQGPHEAIAQVPECLQAALRTRISTCMPALFSITTKASKLTLSILPRRTSLSLGCVIPKRFAAAV
jgi:hypothetical protein